MIIITFILYIIGLYNIVTGYNKNKPISSTIKQIFCAISTAMWGIITIMLWKI